MKDSIGRNNYYNIDDQGRVKLFGVHEHYNNIS